MNEVLNFVAENWASILKISVYSVTTVIPATVGFLNARKSKKEAEKANAEVDLTTEANNLIAAAEESFKQLDCLMKKQGKTAGAAKKENVLKQLAEYASLKGYKFDVDYWSSKIDSIVALTKVVNKK